MLFPNKIRGQNREHDAAVGGGIREKHLFLPLRRHVHIGGEVIFAGLECRNTACKIYIAQFQIVSSVPAETHDQINVIPDIVSVLDIGPGHIRSGGYAPDCTVFTGKVRHIYDFSFLINTKPDIVKFLHGAVGPGFFQKLIELRAQGRALRVILAKGKAVVVLGKTVVDVIDLRFLGMYGLYPRLVSEETVNLTAEQCGDAVRIRVEEEILAVRKISMCGVLHQRADQHTDAFTVIVLLTHSMRIFRCRFCCRILHSNSCMLLIMN